MTKIVKAPKVLVISLQRLLLNNKKNDAVVYLNEEITIKDYIDHNGVCSIYDTQIYDLHSVINHKGTLDYGHYFSDICVKVNNPQYNNNLSDVWMQFDDSRVSSMGKFINKYSSEAYSLFYIKR